MEFLYSTGVRISELVQLNRSDINLSEGTAKVIGKGNKERIVYLNTRSKMSMREYFDSRTDTAIAAFATNMGSRLTKGGVSTRLKVIADEANLKNVHAHKFRRTTATVALNKGMPIEQVKDMLGHESISTTTIYAKSSKENIMYSHKKYLNG